MDLTNIPTRELVEELKKREGVSNAVVAPYVEYEVNVSAEGDDVGVYENETGPAIILVVTD